MSDRTRSPAFGLDLVTGRVYLTCEPDAEAVEEWSRRGIHNVLNVAIEAGDNPSLTDGRLRVVRVSLEDGVPIPLEQAEACLRSLRDLELGAPTVVHCTAGVSRSAAVVALYLIATGRAAGYLDALRWVRSRRATVNPSPALVTEEVVALAQRLRSE